MSTLTLVVCVLTRITFNFASNSVENATNPATPDDSPRLKFLQTACPSSTDNLTLHWHEFPPAAVTNKSTGEMEGSLAQNLATAKRFCCHSINIVEKPPRVNSSVDLEIMIRKDRNSDPALYFPVIAHTKEETQYQRRFFPLYRSPGPAIIHARLDHHDTPKHIRLIQSSWPLLILFIVTTALAGIVMWLLVRK